ncbi:MAG: hypothetical protein HUU45_00245 [Leptospiraceae bacterium]|nr:hypothetical protein [Leptospiraceae bacterium]
MIFVKNINPIHFFNQPIHNDYKSTLNKVIAIEVRKKFATILDKTSARSIM